MPLDNAVRDGEAWYPPMVHRLAPTAQVWAGEDGPAPGGDDGTGGQNNSVLGTYATLPWYANDLGHRAALGFSQYQRQDLVGGRYALLGISHDNEALALGDPVRLQPDFWVAFLWKRVMGNTVFNATAGALNLDPAVRAYAHCGLPPSPHAPARTVTPTKGKPLLSTMGSPMGITLVNLNSTSPKQVKLPASLGAATAWTLSAGAGGVFGSETLLNGEALPLFIADGAAIEAVPVAGGVVGRGGTVTLPPFSVCFVVVAECTT